MCMRDAAACAVAEQHQRDGSTLRRRGARSLKQPRRGDDHHAAVRVGLDGLEPQTTATIGSPGHEPKAPMMLAKGIDAGDEPRLLGGEVGQPSVSNEQRVHAVEVEAIPHVDPRPYLARSVEASDGIAHVVRGCLRFGDAC